jgi:hypothetical protein
VVNKGRERKVCVRENEIKGNVKEESSSMDGLSNWDTEKVQEFFNIQRKK